MDKATLNDESSDSLLSQISRSPPRLPKNSWPHQFIKIQLAGRGAAGEVHYAISREAVTESHLEAGLPPPTSHIVQDGTSPRTKRPNPLLLAAIKRRICALKIGYPSLRDSIAHEATLLSLLKTPINCPRSHHLASLIAADSSSRHPWLATTAILGHPLSTFLPSLGPDVPALFYHTFIQLTTALRFLHELRPYPLVHGDLHLGNVMCDFVHQDFPGLPNLVLIDFGQARVVGWDESARERDIGHETSRFVAMVRQLGRGVEMWRFAEEEGRAGSCAGLWERLGEEAVELRERYATGEALEVVGRAMREVGVGAERGKGILDDAVVVEALGL